MKVIIAGGRDFDDYQLVRDTCDVLFNGIFKEVEIVSGRCDTGKFTFLAKDGRKVFGVDGLGERYAENREMKVHYFPANWKEYGKSAGAIRNKQMAEIAQMLVVFWDKESKGTKIMIDITDKKGLRIEKFYY